LETPVDDFIVPAGHTELPLIVVENINPKSSTMKCAVKGVSLYVEVLKRSPNVSAVDH
jgi:hypothetical protein